MLPHHAPAPNTTASEVIRLGCLGLSGFERDTLEAYFRLAARQDAQGPIYRWVGGMEEAQWLLADAQTPGLHRQVATAGRLQDTLFIGGALPPAGAASWLPRPVDALQIKRRLDDLLARRAARAHRGRLQRREHPSGRARQLAADHSRVQDFRLSTGYSNSVLAEGDERLDAVLVVSSSPAERLTLRDWLRDLGYRVSVAADADAAITAARRRAWRFIFLGMAMAQGDTYQTCRRLKQSDIAGEPAVVLIGMSPSVTDHIRATFAGCDAWLAQPLAEADLLQVLSRHDPVFERVFEPTAPLSL